MVLENRKKKELHHGVRRDYGKALIWLTLVFVVLGLAIVYSASSHVSEGLSGDSTFFLHRQAEKALVGVALMFMFSKIDYRKMNRYTKPLLLISTGLLLLLLLLPESSPLLGGPRSVSDGGEKIRRWYSTFWNFFSSLGIRQVCCYPVGSGNRTEQIEFNREFFEGSVPFSAHYGRCPYPRCTAAGSFSGSPDRGFPLHHPVSRRFEEGTPGPDSVKRYRVFCDLLLSGTVSLETFAGFPGTLRDRRWHQLSRGSVAHCNRVRRSVRCRVGRRKTEAVFPAGNA